MNYALTYPTRNRKLGARVAVSTSPRATCPASCAHLKNRTCYAMRGPLGMFWDKVSDGRAGHAEDSFIDRVAALPRSAALRHNQAGDFPADSSGKIDGIFLSRLTHAARGMAAAWSYTHHAWKVNAAAIVEAARRGFTVNVSADTIADAVAAFRAGLPSTVTVAHDSPDAFEQDGVKFRVCPEQTGAAESCRACRFLCARAERGVVIAFRDHGPGLRVTEKPQN